MNTSKREAMAILDDLADQWLGVDPEKRQGRACDVQSDGSVRLVDIEIAPRGTLSTEHLQALGVAA